MLLTATLLSSCGYQLQKPLSIEAQAQPVYVEGSLLLSIQLKRELIANNIHVSNDRHSAKSIISIHSINYDNRSFSVSKDGHDAEIQRNLSAEVKWVYKNNPAGASALTAVHASDESSDERRTILPYTVVSAEIVQVQNPDNKAAQQQESELLLRELHAEIITKTISLIRYH